MLKRRCGWRYGTAACALALLAAGLASPRDEKPPSRSGDDKPSPEAVKLLRLSVREFVKKNDADKDGKLSWKETKAVFDRFDADEDGSVDQKELTEALKKMAGKDAKVDQHVITFFREHDANKDSKFSAKEAKILFDGADTDKDELLDENELVAAGSRLLPPAKAPPAKDAVTPPTRTETPPTARTRRLVALVGLRVVLGRDDALGTVVDVVIDQEGRVAFLVVQDATNRVAVPWGAVSYSADAKALAVTARVTRAALKGVTFAEGRYPDFTSEAWLKGARVVWGERALPGAPATATQPGQKTPERKIDKERPPVKPRTKEKEKPDRRGERP